MDLTRKGSLTPAICVLACAVLACTATVTTAESSLSTVPLLSLAQAETPPAEGAVPLTRSEVETAKPAEEPGLPISLGVSYYLLSDYVFRGINFSEYPGEGSEKLNHQMTTEFSWKTASFGTFGFDTFFEWYAAQQKINPYANHLQEIDYIIRWGYSLEPIKTDLTLGYTFYEFPKLAKLLRTDEDPGNNNDDHTSEWWFRLEHNDAWMWKWLLPSNDEGVLNPSFFFAQDVGTGCGHVWMEFALSHSFKVIENLTLTPGYLIAVDGGLLRRYLDRPNADTFRLAYDQWSLNVTYDLTKVLRLPKWAGSLSVSGLLYYNNALGTAEKDIDDEFYGGMSVNWGLGD